VTEAERCAEVSSAESGLKLLDDLIVKYGDVLMKKSDDDAKLGDFLKMIELRRKLTPENLEKKELWNLLKKIRNESMKDHPLMTSKQTLIKP
jgi:hypothetical protein